MNKQIKAGIILQYLQMAISIIINLVYTPIMIRMLGQTEYGLYNLASSIISYLLLLSLGFNASYIRFYSRYKKENDEDKIKNLNGLYLLVFIFMGLVSLIAGLILSFNVEIFFNDTYSMKDLHMAKVLMIFLTINLALSFPASVFGSYVISQEKFIFQKLLNIGKTVLSPCFCIVVLFMGYGSIGMVICTTSIVVIIDFINMMYCTKKLKMRFKFRNFQKGLLKEIFVFSFFIAINQIIDQINWQTDKIILAKMINATAVSIYAVGATINTMYISFSNAICNVFVPRIHRIVNQNDSDMDEQITNLFIKVGRIQFFVIMLVLTGFVFFGEYFITIWAGSEYVEAYFVSLLLICPVTIPLIQNLGVEIQRAKNLHKFRSIVYLIMAIVNVGMSIWFCSMWGVVGVSVGTAISMILANIIVMNIYYHKKCGIDINKFWISIMRAFLGMILPICYGIITMLLIDISSIWMLLVLIIVYTLIYFVSVYFLSFNAKEKSYISYFFHKIFKKNHSNKIKETKYNKNIKSD